MDMASQAPATAPLPRRRLLLAADLGEKAFILALFALMTTRVVQSVASGAVWLNFLQLGSEGIAVVLILLRKPAREMSLRPVDWLLAIGATAAPLLVKPDMHAAPWAPAGLCAGLMLTGLLFQVIAKLTLRLSFGMAPANRGLKVSGPYRIVRHPIYASYLIGQAGFFLLNPTWWNAAIYGVGLAIQIFRIEAEERVLAHDEGFAAFRAATRYRLVPGLY
ncbi:MAG TPA: methyltransferase [Caulobacteraceae bacterium]|nr:methyltransferase [Caulobacteraceae bacterium]